MENNLSIVKDQFKELPNNIEAEQAVIGSILVSNDIFDEISTIISSINFYDPMHQKIFEAVESLIYKGMLANPITLKNYFEDEKDDLDVPEYLVKINRRYDHRWVRPHLQQILHLMQRRNYKRVVKNLLSPSFH